MADRLSGTSFGSANVQARATEGAPLNVTVEVGDWEHECCGPAIERNDVVDLGCLRWRDADGQVRLIETHHDSPIETRVRGRVVDILVLAEDGSSTPVLRVPSGVALRGFDDEDDGHLETPWSGELVDERNRHFLVTVKS
jgi:hypothetical protein